LARYQVSYTAFPINAPRRNNPTEPGRRILTHRPIVPVRLDYEGRVFSLYSILDSGADQCLFPGFILSLLGLDGQRAQVSTFQGVGSVNQVSLFFENIGLTVGVIPRLVATVAFSTALDQCGYGLLGQGGFFSRFKVEFDLPNGFFYIEG
jgi:hypothetical protein